MKEVGTFIMQLVMHYPDNYGVMEKTHTILASLRENLSSGFLTKLVSNQSTQLQRLPREF